MVQFTVYKGSSDGKIVKATHEKGPLTGDQCLLRVTASGLCGTDEHYRHADMVLGHEGVGVVEEVGPAVQTLKKGDRVGWGYEHDCCGNCAQCLSGKEIYCPERKMYGVADLDQGSFASHAIWREAFLFKLPDNISDEEAAPLMCGGATVFTALNMYNVLPTSRVGVVGVGGLGHLAIQFASKMGCDVVVFSGTDSKREEAFKLGATEFHAMKDVKKAEDLKIKPIDVLLVTTSQQPDWGLYLELMAPEGYIFPLTVAFEPLVIPYMPWLQRGITIQATIVAPRYIHKRMIDFCSRHGIKPMLNRFPLTCEGIEQAMETLSSGKMRYRGVLTPAEK